RVATCPSDSSPGIGGVSREGVSRNAEITETEARHNSARSARKRRRLSRRCQRVVSVFAVIVGGRQSTTGRLRPSGSFEGPARLPGAGISRLLPGLRARLGQRPLGG